MKPLISKKYAAHGSGGLAVGADLAKAHPDVVDFTLGDPDLTTPVAIIDAAAADARAGHTHYTDSRGDEELIAAIVDFKKRNTAWIFRLKMSSSPPPPATACGWFSKPCSMKATKS